MILIKKKASDLRNNQILSIKNLSKSFDGVRALNKLNLNIEKQSITALIGPNGSGKTTLINVIMGYLDADRDTKSINFKGQNLIRLSPYNISARGIGRTFQIGRIFPGISVMDNMLIALEEKKREGLFYGLNPFITYRCRRIEEEARVYLKIAELDDMAHEMAGNLSHGQRRLLELMRARALNADLYLFDEPTAGVFPEIRKRIIALFREWRESGKSIVFAEHDMQTVREVAQRVIVLDKGEVIADGKPDVVLEDKKVIDAYFGGEE